MDPSVAARAYIYVHKNQLIGTSTLTLTQAIDKASAHTGRQFRRRGNDTNDMGHSRGTKRPTVGLWLEKEYDLHFNIDIPDTTTQKKPLKLRSTTLIRPCSWSHHAQSPWHGSMGVELKPLPLGFVDTISFWKWAVYLFAPPFTLGGPPSRWDYFSAIGSFRLL